MRSKEIVQCFTKISNTRLATALKSVKSSSEILRQSFLVLMICAFTDILAGISLGGMNELLLLLPGLIVIIPGAIGMRGNNFASMGSRLATKMHSGEIDASAITKIQKTPLIIDNIYASFAQTFNMSLLLAVLAYLLGRALGFQMIPLSHLIFISIIGGLISGVILMVSTIYISIESFKRGWDPDNITTPLITALGDIITIPSIFLAALLSIHLKNYNAIASIILILIGIFLLYYGFRRENSREILVQTLPTFIVCAVFTTTSGLILGYKMDEVVIYTAILMLVPSFNETGGNLGSIFAARLSSSLYTGIEEKKLGVLPSWETIKSFFPFFILSLCIFPALALILNLVSINMGFSSPGFFNIFYLCMVGGAMITFISLLMSYFFTSFSWKMGLDPDNVVIPLLTSVMDVVGISCLMISMNLVGI
jgi:Permease, similar to cation transporters